METETMAVGFGGEAVNEYAGQIFRRNTNAIVHDRDPDPAVIICDPQGKYFSSRPSKCTSLFSVANEIDQDLHHFLLLQRDRGHLGIFSRDGQLIAGLRTGVDTQSILKEIADSQLAKWARR